MTTIAYRSGVMAADTRETDDGLILPTCDEKIIQLPNGGLIGAAGASEQCIALMEHSARGLRANIELDDCEGLRVQPDGTIEVYEGKLWRPVKAPFYAIGSGREIALTAMMMKASAKKAVEIACKLDAYTHGPVTTLTLVKNENKRRTPRRPVRRNR
jgi:ATP-dependent protease HslVU (ClpYQ) peptidase subunit